MMDLLRKKTSSTACWVKNRHVSQQKVGNFGVNTHPCFVSPRSKKNGSRILSIEIHACLYIIGILIIIMGLLYIYNPHI